MKKRYVMKVALALACVSALAIPSLVVQPETGAARGSVARAQVVETALIPGSPSATQSVIVTYAPPSPWIEWVAVPGGVFTMGSSQADIDTALAECNATEGMRTGRPCQREWFYEPVRTVYVGSFEMTRYEITNAQYRTCVAAGLCGAAGRMISDTNIPYSPVFFQDNYPVVGVSWYDAHAFCSWLGGRLPSEEEWERAARGNDGRRYPWGYWYEPTRANLDTGYPMPVGAYPSGISPYGLMDMAGNVFEWTATSVGNRYVVRGGGWSKYYFRGRVTDRGTQLEPTFANYDIGFRCVR